MDSGSRCYRQEESVTPRQRVLKTYPQAYLWRWQRVKFYGVEIDTPSPNTLGQGTSPQQAWAEAARNLRPPEKNSERKER